MVFIVVRFKGVVRTSVYPMETAEEAVLWLDRICQFIEERAYSEEVIYDTAILSSELLASYIATGYPDNG